MKLRKGFFQSSPAVYLCQGAIFTVLTEAPVNCTTFFVYQSVSHNGPTIHELKLPPKWGLKMCNRKPFFCDTMFEMVR